MQKLSENKISKRWLWFFLVVFLVIGASIGYVAHPDEKTTIVEVKVPDRLESLRLYASVAEQYYNISVIKEVIPDNNTILFWIFSEAGVPRIQILAFSDFVDFVKVNGISEVNMDDYNIMLWVKAGEKAYFWEPERA